MSVLLVMWAAKKTKKGVSAADKEFKRRSQIRRSKRLSKLGLNEPHLSSTPDLVEDPFSDPTYEETEERSWDSLSLPDGHAQIIKETAIPPEAASAVSALAASENAGRKSYHVELRRSSSIHGYGQRDGNRSFEFGNDTHMSARRNTTTGTTAFPRTGKIPARPNDRGYQRSTTTENILEHRHQARLSLEGPGYEESIEEEPLAAPVTGKKARPGSRLLKRMSTWRKSSMVPPPLALKRAGSDF